MTMKSINAESFYKEVVFSGHVWTIQTDDGVPTFEDKNGNATIFLWSSRERVVRIVEKDSLFKGFKPLEIPWTLFASKWLPDFASNKFVFSLNWTGNENAVWEESAEELAINMESHIKLYNRTD